jgi:hypothetical protein
LCYEQNYRTFLRALAGVILLGTPHFTEKKGTKWQRVGMVMPDLPKKQRSLSSGDMASLTTSSMQFERAAVNVPILSVHETKKTKVKTGFITSKKTLVSTQAKRMKHLNFGLALLTLLKLMDAEFVRTRSRNEELLGIDLDHNTICNLNVTADYFERICEFIDASLQETRLKIIKGSPKCLRLPLHYSTMSAC